MARTRARRTVGLLGLAAALASVIVTAGGATTSAASFRECGTPVSARWRQGGETGTKWYVLATPNYRCVGALGWVGELAPRAASSGSVDTIEFSGGSGWACWANRSLLMGLCVSRDPAGSGNRVVIVMAGTTANGILLEGFTSGSAGATAALERIVNPGGGGSRSTLPGLGLEGRTGRAPTACTVTRGPEWRLVSQRRSGSGWKAYAGGGLTCLAAQGWVADVGARLARHGTAGPGQFDGGDGWHCVIGTQGAYVGACARVRRASEPGGDLEPKYVAIAPSGVQSELIGRLASHGYDAAVRTIHHASERAGTFDRCAGYKGVRWRAGSATGDRWLYGTAGGYPCRIAAGALETIATWAASSTGDRNVGVLGDWRCTSTESALRTVCTWRGPSPAAARTQAPLRIAVVADRTGAPAALGRLLAD